MSNDDDEWERTEIELAKLKIAEATDSAVVMPNRLLNFSSPKEINFFQDDQQQFLISNVNVTIIPTIEVPIDSTLQDALQSARERMQVLNIENMILTFVKSNDRSLEIAASQYNAFRRLLVYRVAQRFRLEHNTSDVATENNERGILITVFRTPDVCYPRPLLIDVRFDNDATNDNSPLSSQLNISLTGNSQQIPSNSSQPTSASSSTKKVLVMKRNTSKSGEMSNKDNSGNKNQQSAMDKEKAYAAARARIFGLEEAGNDEYALAYEDTGIKTNDSPAPSPASEISTNNYPNTAAMQQQQQQPPSLSISKNKSKSSLDGSENNTTTTQTQNANKISDGKTTPNKKTSNENNLQQNLKPSPPQLLIQNKNVATSVPLSQSIERSTSTPQNSNKSSCENLSIGNNMTGNNIIEQSNFGSSASTSSSKSTSGNNSRSKKSAVVDPSTWKDSNKFTLRDKDAERSDPDFARRNHNNNSSSQAQSSSSKQLPQQSISQQQRMSPSPPLNNNGNNHNLSGMNTYLPNYHDPQSAAAGMMPMYSHAPAGTYVPGPYSVPPNLNLYQPNISSNNLQPQWMAQPVPMPMNPAYYHNNAALPVPLHMYNNQLQPPLPPDYYMPSNQYSQNRNYQQHQQSNQNTYTTTNNNSNTNNQTRSHNNNVKDEFPPLGNS